MARPLKSGLDYFPHSCIATREIRLIQMEFGLSGYAVVYKLYELIFFENGYYLKWTKDVALMFAHENGVGVNVVSEIISAMFRRDILSEKLYKMYGILTSKEIQENYLTATQKRKQVFLYEEYLLIKCTHFSENVVINRINDGINEVNSRKNTQSKVNKSKVNKSKVKASLRDVSEIEIPCVDGTYLIGENEINQLQQLYENINVIISLRRMINYLTLHKQSQLEKANMENRIRLWLEEDKEKALNPPKSDDNKKALNPHQTDDKPKETSYDITALNDMDLAFY